MIATAKPRRIQVWVDVIDGETEKPVDCGWAKCAEFATEEEACDFGWEVHQLAMKMARKIARRRKAGR